MVSASSHATDTTPAACGGSSHEPTYMHILGGPITRSSPRIQHRLGTALLRGPRQPRTLQPLGYNTSDQRVRGPTAEGSLPPILLPACHRLPETMHRTTPLHATFPATRMSGDRPGPLTRPQRPAPAWPLPSSSSPSYARRSNGSSASGAVVIAAKTPGADTGVAVHARDERVSCSHL